MMKVLLACAILLGVFSRASHKKEAPFNGRFEDSVRRAGYVIFFQMKDEEYSPGRTSNKGYFFSGSGLTVHCDTVLFDGYIYYCCNKPAKAN